MATITKRGKKWLAQVRRKGYPHQSAMFGTKTEAQAWASSVEGDMARNRWVDTSEAEQTTLADAMQRYLAEVSILKKGHKQEIYRVATINKHKLAKFALAHIRGRDVAAYRDDRLKVAAPTTVNNELILLSHLFTTATKEWGMESLDNPVAKIRRPKLPKGRERRISPDEEARLLDTMPTLEMRVAVILAIETGMRRQELATLTWGMVQGSVIYLDDSKNNTRRQIPLSSRCVDALKSMPRRIDGRLFAVHPESIGRNFRNAAIRAGLHDVRFHDLRHEATSRLFERGLNVMEVAAITGHKTLGMLQRYTHLKADDLARKLG